MYIEGNNKNLLENVLAFTLFTAHCLLTEVVKSIGL